MAIEADRQVLAAVVGNLLQNAFKFTRPRTTVTLRVGASAKRVLIEIYAMWTYMNTPFLFALPDVKTEELERGRKTVRPGAA